MKVFCTHRLCAANKFPNGRAVPPGRKPEEVLEGDIGDIHLGGELGAPRCVPLAVALINEDRKVVVEVLKGVVGHVANVACAAAATQAGLEVRLGAWPDLETGPRGRVGQRHVVDVQVLHDIELFGILAQRANRNTMGRVALETLYQDVRAVGLKSDAVVVVVDVRVLDHDVIGSVRVPSIEILRGVLRSRLGKDVNVRDDEVRAVRDQVMPLHGHRQPFPLQ